MSANLKKVEAEDHAISNARGWYQTISELVAALECDYDRLEELTDERSDLVEALDCESSEDRDAFAKAQGALSDWDEENGDELKELTEAATYEGELQTDADAVRERIQEGPLSVEVRSGWYSPGGDSAPEEFNILLSTGGPALRIRGELDEHCQPSRAWLEYQDWGTSWTQYFDAEQATLLTYCQQFYFGE